MEWFSGIVVFVIIWWVALFAVLPWGIVHDESEGTGAPKIPNLKKKMLITTGITIVLWIVVYVLIEIEFISFYDSGQAMFKEDFG